MKDAHQLNAEFWAMVRQMDAAQRQENAAKHEAQRATAHNNSGFDLTATAASKKGKG
ncbi:MAG: hypothetical protein IPJ65_05985 [Archangiaceae bacterium]|nr:hypothetical protein [Archangiaceae bacterium]